TTYEMSDAGINNLEQVDPVKDTEDFIISMAQKNRENIERQEELKSRHHLRIEFWEKMLEALSPVNSLYQNVNPTTDNWLTAGSGVGGIHYSTVVTKLGPRIELVISGRSQESNKVIFDLLKDRHAKIEEAFGKPLIWE